MSNHKRSMVKAISFRILATLTTMILVFLFTQDLTIILGIGLLDIISKIFLFYAHERVWNSVSWGKK